MKAFPLTNVVVALQMACSWAILASLRDTGVLQFGPFSWQKARCARHTATTPLTVGHAAEARRPGRTRPLPAAMLCVRRQLAGITVLYTGNTVFSLVGLKTLNIPMCAHLHARRQAASQPL